ncbi:MAG: hypothetical protein JW705_03910 [Methanosarcinaceae archaeon]|nr:hypothetical protein [Methanosarcinaceae archaeon]
MRILAIVKEMLGHEFAFSFAIRDLGAIKELKVRYDCTDVLEISGILDIGEMSLIEPGVLRITGKFGDFDFSLNESQLKKI